MYPVTSAAIDNTLKPPPPQPTEPEHVPSSPISYTDTHHNSVAQVVGSEHLIYTLVRNRWEILIEEVGAPGVASARRWTRCQGSEGAEVGEEAGAPRRGLPLASKQDQGQEQWETAPFPTCPSPGST